MPASREALSDRKIWSVVYFFRHLARTESRCELEMYRALAISTNAMENAMGWSATADKRVVDAVIATFCDPVESSLQKLAGFKYSEWLRTYHWLDASGMALYFLHQIEALGLESAIPAAMLGRLRQNLADNRKRTAAMFAEFTALNQAFRRAGVEYCSLKGFTLIPESCPDPTLRCQLDLDFLVAGDDLKRCREVLAAAGYTMMAVTNSVWEFKAGAVMPGIGDHYKPKTQRSVELHFASPATAVESPFNGALLDRRITRSLDGQAFPALSDADQFVSQALHIFGHLCSANTRVSWLLEYQRHVSVRRDDGRFWNDVRERAQTHRHAYIAIGLATLLSFRIFGGETPPQLDEWTLARLPATVHLWADHYGREALLADFPGTKLYLLLRDELANGDGSWQREKRSALLPIHWAPRILQAGNDDKLRQRFFRSAFQLRFILFRFRFHTIQGLRYLVESRRWKRRVAVLYQDTRSRKAITDCRKANHKPHAQKL